ncbi:glutathione S-transferase family protein [soil metagenome]
MADCPDTLTLYTNPMSRGRIARWMLEEVGAPYDTVLVDYGAPMQGAAYRAVNPMRKVPALVHERAGARSTVTECAAICAYLADAFPAAGLAPPLPGRGAYYRWLFFAAGPLEAAVTNAALGVEVPPDKRGFVGYGDLAAVTDTLEQAVSAAPHVAGDAFSAADVYVGSHVGWGLQFGTIERRPAFEAYWSRLEARPAHSRAAGLDDAAMAAAASPSG